MEGNQSFTFKLTVPRDIFKIMWMQSDAANTKPTPAAAQTVHKFTTANDRFPERSAS